MQTVVFLDDQTSSIEDFIEVAKNSAFDVAVANHLDDLLFWLDTPPGTPGCPDHPIAGVVLDEMIPSIVDFKDYGVCLSTKRGTQAGQAVAQVFFRGETAAFKETPICFLSQIDDDERAASIRNSVNKDKNQKQIPLILKLTATAKQDFQRWLDSL